MFSLDLYELWFTTVCIVHKISDVNTSFLAKYMHICFCPLAAAWLEVELDVLLDVEELDVDVEGGGGGKTKLSKPRWSESKQVLSLCFSAFSWDRKAPSPILLRSMIFLHTLQYALNLSSAFVTQGYVVHHFWLTLSQTTNFRRFQTERGCRRQFQIWWKWQKVLQTGRKHCGKRRNCSLRAISPFPTVFSKDL